MTGLVHRPVAGAQRRAQVLDIDNPFWRFYRLRE
jgi:hypothetical protein